MPEDIPPAVEAWLTRHHMFDADEAREIYADIRRILSEQGPPGNGGRDDG